MNLSFARSSSPLLLKKQFKIKVRKAPKCGTAYAYNYIWVAFNYMQYSEVFIDSRQLGLERKMPHRKPLLVVLKTTKCSWNKRGV